MGNTGKEGEEGTTEKKETKVRVGGGSRRGRKGEEEGRGEEEGK